MAARPIYAKENPMTWKTALTVLALTALAATLWMPADVRGDAADIAAAPAEVTALVESAMGRIVDENYVEAYDLLAEQSVISAESFTQLKVQTVQQRTAIRPQFGQALGYEPLEIQPVGDSLIRYRYLERLPQHGMVWTFVFYRGQDRWSLYNVNFDDKLSAVFD
jgi:hypothetical protein